MRKKKAWLGKAEKRRSHTLPMSERKREVLARRQCGQREIVGLVTNPGGTVSYRTPNATERTKAGL